VLSCSVSQFRKRTANSNAHHSPWIFRGHAPDKPISAGYITTHLKDVFSSRAARLGTLHELTKLGPTPIIAEALDYSPTTIEKHRIDSAAAYSQYIAAIRET
jgi:hypothetical protein